jgi:hypothetical protein
MGQINPAIFADLPSVHRIARAQIKAGFASSRRSWTRVVAAGNLRFQHRHWQGFLGKGSAKANNFRQSVEFFVVFKFMVFSFIYLFNLFIYHDFKMFNL